MSLKKIESVNEASSNRYKSNNTSTKATSIHMTACVLASNECDVAAKIFKFDNNYIENR